MAPAGSQEALYAAVAAGADAVYLGGKAFGARAFASNFDLEALKRATEYCHLHRVRIFVTVNTLVYEREIPDWLEFCRALYEMGVDALIATDLGGVSLLRKYLPDMELHASTQMGIHNSEGISIAAQLGFSRAVVARECSLSDIREMADKAPLELEVFLHGALCVCHSGQCLFSSLVGGRSGNRGECAQPCRLPYGDGEYPLSLKDLSLARHITSLLDAGVSSLKIEGRMKSADYVYGVTSIYRRLLDERRNATAEEERMLASLFSRDGFTDGYFTGRLGGMTGVRTEAQKEESRALEKRDFSPCRIPVSGEAVFRLGEPSRLTLFAPHKTVTVVGEMPVTAISAPLTEDEVKQRLSKMGNTYLSLSPEALTVHLDKGVNLAPSLINALRRAAAEEMEKTGREAPAAISAAPPRRDAPSPLTTAVFYGQGAYEALSEDEKKAFDIAFVPLLDFVQSPSDCGVLLPPVIMERDMREVRELIRLSKEKGAKYAQISNLSHIPLCREAGLIPIGDFRMNLYNPYSAEVLSSLGVERSLCSPELTAPRACGVGGVLVYGRVPLMLTERCFVKENGGCGACGKFFFTDRRGMRFPVLREYSHRSLILNSLPTYMGDKGDELRRYGLCHRHFIFTTESVGEIREILRAYKRGEALLGQVRRIGVSEARVYGESAEKKAALKQERSPAHKPQRQLSSPEKHNKPIYRKKKR